MTRARGFSLVEEEAELGFLGALSALGNGKEGKVLVVDLVTGVEEVLSRTPNAVVRLGIVKAEGGAVDLAAVGARIGTEREARELAPPQGRGRIRGAG